LPKFHASAPPGAPCWTDLEAREWPPKWVRRGASSILLALTDTDYPSGALLRSCALAQSLGTGLQMLRVLPRVSPPTWDRELDFVQTTRRIQRCLAATRQTRVWCEALVEQRLPVRQLRTRIGDFVDQVVVRATELNAGLIVLAPSTGRVGPTATAVARASSRAVLVSRRSPRLTPLLAASDLEDQDFWVLRKAAELSARFGTPIVALHNVSCLPGVALSPHESPARRLTRALAALPSPGLPVLTSELDPVDAIFDQARAHDANSIVVGVRRRPWLERLIRHDVAADIVERSDRSVVVVPQTRLQGPAAEAPPTTTASG